MENRLNQRGSILVYALLIMSAMLAIGLSLNALFIQKIRRLSAAQSSTVSIYVADSAAEMCLYEARNGKQDPLVLDNADATFSISSKSGATVIDITNNCTVLSTASFDFHASGIYRGNQRTLEISQ